MEQWGYVSFLPWQYFVVSPESEKMIRMFSFFTFAFGASVFLWVEYNAISSIVSEIESENRLVRYEVPKLGLEGMAVYIVSDQEVVDSAVVVVYKFRLLYNQADQMKDTYEAVFNHMLSTFRFMEQ